MQPENTQYRVRVNNYIRVPQIRVVLNDGSNGGIMSTRDALRLAQDQGFDLVEINPKSSPPVCKIMDYGKYKYEEKKKQAELRKNQKAQELKEITFRPNTDENDLKHKLEGAREFLQDGNKVKFTIRFRGREVTHPEVAKEKINWIVEQLGDLIATPSPAMMEGKFMFLIVTPSKK
jgi:translation initiation factor IF-3